MPRFKLLPLEADALMIAAAPKAHGAPEGGPSFFARVFRTMSSAATLPALARPGTPRSLTTLVERIRVDAEGALASPDATHVHYSLTNIAEDAIALLERALEVERERDQALAALDAAGTVLQELLREPDRSLQQRPQCAERVRAALARTRTAQADLIAGELTGEPESTSRQDRPRGG